MKRILLAGGLAVVLAAVVTWWLHERPPVILGTAARFPPFTMVVNGAEPRITGLDVDVAQAVADRLGRRLEIVDLPVEDLVAALNEERVDLVVSALLITPELAEQVDISEPYYMATQCLLMREGETAPESEEDLQGRKIGAPRGTASETLARALAGAEHVRPAASAKGAVVDLLNSLVDFAVVSEQAAEVLRPAMPEAVRVPIAVEPEFFGVAVRKGNVEWLAIVNQTLDAARRDGRHEAWLNRWLLHTD